MANKTIYFVTIILFFISCKSIRNEKKDIAFNNKYKFKAEIESESKKDALEPDFQSYATEYSFKTDHKNALKYWDLEFTPKIIGYNQFQFDSIKNLYETAKAKDYILNQSKENKIVIINESHHNASHRVFTESLLKELFNNGYKNLFLEALTNGDKKDSLLNSRKYPIQNSGYYTKNPQFGNLIRTAKEIGYTIYPYETTGNEGGAKREIEQANNIYKIIKEKPSEKNLIHCGSGHAIEGNVSFFGGLSLAGRLHKLTGINPLTIDQVFYSEKSTFDYSNIFVQSFDFKHPSILLDKNSNPFAYKNNDRWIDIVVFHPLTKYISNRPNWLFENGNNNVAINISNLNLDFPIMIFAYNKGENLNASIPIDVIEIEYKTDYCNLALKNGTYEIVATNGTMSVKFEQKVK
ncbi:hypothetical protein ACJOV8_002550 [Formosa sp. 3Alg 14/1]|uniref:hypothetical protein n=1 Tax=Formosa sp. 3Alg 14/1 TaxID=3382190 RepID=UPI0039BE241F